ncbi:MAG TPA: DEAD/DEAH box helicase [Myxococcaceae bacterium]|nr:DEAD/DEAH box helicase [Myxococcaceae bacterium]
MRATSTADSNSVARADGNAISIALSPLGHLYLESAGPDEVVPEAPAAKRIARAFERGTGAGLFHLGAVEVAIPLPPAFAFWRDFGRSFVTALCGVPDLEEKRDAVELAAPPEEIAALVRSAPPMQGGEYLRAEVLEALWAEMLAAFRAEIREADGTVQKLLSKKNAAWHLVGRVHFHLAENRRDPDRPFAFLASYTTGLSPQGRPQHRPLGDALRESAFARDHNRLLALLVPVHRAAEKSDFVRELVDSRHVFQPLGWTAQEAYRFLREIPALEESGVIVRVPDWWKPRQPPRPQVTISVGTREPAGLGLDALLDFSVRLTLDGEELTEKELRELRSAANGLVFLKGRWVEVDRARLDQVLAHWRAVEQQALEGISVAEGMRLLAGAEIGERVSDEGTRGWFGVEAGRWLAGTLQEIRGGNDGVDAGPALLAELRPYQRDGLRWLALLTRLGLGACLADDMGLGKTVQVLALVVLLKQRRALPGPHLLVVPASLIANWKLEAERFAPSLRVLIAHPSVLDSKELATLPDSEVAEADLVVTSYGTVSRLPWIAARQWGLVVLDEAQAIKNPAIKQSRTVKGLRSRSRIALTGTPVENRAGDLWSLFDFLNPGLLGSAKDFTAFVKRADSFGPLRELTRPYILRRLKTDRSIISDLPEKTELRAYCGLTRRQAALYQETVDFLARDLRGVEGIERRGVVLASLLRLKQICNHPSQWLGDGVYAPGDSGKHERLREICEVVASRQEKTLVFTQFREMTGPLAAWLTAFFGRPGLVLSGETAVKERQELVRRFQEDERIPFFVLSLKAGGTGLNLTAASHVIHFDRWWNPAVENQATDRAFRIGQKRNVLVHKLVCRGTVEERIDALIESKQGLARELLEGGGEISLTEMGDEELLALVSLDIHGARAVA